MPQTQPNKKTKSELPKPGADSLGKMPPQAPELEEAVLGAIMIEKDAYPMVADLLQPRSFYNDQHRLIYEAIQSLAAIDQPIDTLTVAEKLKQQGKLVEAGGPTKLAELTNKIASTAHLRYHAQIVNQKATARELIALSSRISEQAYDETQDVAELMQYAEAGVFDISQRQMKRDVVQIDSIITEAFDRMRKAAENEGSISGVPSGFTELDKITSGWQKSDLIILAARPAMGKTAFVLSMVKNIAVDFNRPVAMFSLEMSNVQLCNRLIMNVCEIEGEKIKNGRLTPGEWQQLDSRAVALNGAPVYLDDTPSLSVFELRSKARKLKREHDIQLIIIDYLQLMNASGMNFGSREQEVSIISRNLKALAKELDIPIIALSQLNRNLESRGNGKNDNSVDGKTPQLADLRESGAIEQDADMVLFIHRPEYFRIFTDSSGNDLRGMAKIIIAKHRNGATGDVMLRFRPNFAKFQNLDDTDEPMDSKPSGATSQPAYISTASKMNSMNISDADGATAGSDDRPW